jgi:hypothetical protein
MTVSVVDAAAEPGMTLAGEKVAVAPAGSPLTANVTALENPPVPGVMVILHVPLWPAETLSVGVPAATAKSVPISVAAVLVAAAKLESPE